MSQELAGIPANKLRDIASALRAGRLSVPLSRLALTPYIKGSSNAAAAMLERLTFEGMSSDHLAFFLESLASARESRPRIEDAIELVCTGPESATYPARDTRIVVRELFRQAEHFVVVAGYAVYQGHDVFRALAERIDASDELRVAMFLDVQRRLADTTASGELLHRFADRLVKQEWPGTRVPEVYYDPRSLEFDPPKRSSLHAKCVVVDERVAFISSANFTEAAHVRNIEVGVLIQSAPFARRLSGHFMGLADRGMLQRLPGT